MKKKKDKHPKQPKVLDSSGTLRFKRNDIVRFLLDTSNYDLNNLIKMHFDEEDMKQFYQLIGYSVDGYQDVFSDNVEEESNEND